MKSIQNRAKRPRCQERQERQETKPNTYFLDFLALLASWRSWREILLVYFLLALGCAANRPRLPVYPNVSAPMAAKIIQSRFKSIHTISTRGLMTLTRPDGQSVRLDAAIVARPPDQLHLRAWKMNRTIFDLTLSNGQLWMLNPDDPKLRDRMKSSGVGAAQFARTWANLNGTFFAQAGLQMRAQNQNFIFTRNQKSTSITCLVDRTTLTPAQYILRDQQGHRRLVLKLSDYSLHDGIAYPNCISAESSNGTIDLILRDVRLNTPLAPGAFVPSPRAEKVR